jgi:hypothetical protein
MRGTRIALLCSFLAVSMSAGFGLAFSAQPWSALKRKAQLSLALLKQEWIWARRMEPSQPLTSRVSKDNWSGDDKLS